MRNNTYNTPDNSRLSTGGPEDPPEDFGNEVFEDSSRTPQGKTSSVAGFVGGHGGLVRGVLSSGMMAAAGGRSNKVPKNLGPDADSSQTRPLSHLVRPLHKDRHRDRLGWAHRRRNKSNIGLTLLLLFARRCHIYI